MGEDTAPAEPCWLCTGLKGIALHVAWSERRGKPLWTAHKPTSQTHPVRACPQCRLATVMRIVSAWCVEANDVGGVDAGDLAFRLEEADCPLPDLEEAHRG